MSVPPRQIGDSVLSRLLREAIKQLGGMSSILKNKLSGNPAIMPSTKSKITYDSKGLVINGEDLTKEDFGLGEVDNTSDADKPISALTQDALDLKANILAPTFTGIATFIGSVEGIDKAMVGLGNVENTSDIEKIISASTQDALDLKQDLTYNYPVNVISTATNATVKEAYVFTSNVTLTLPSTPLSGDWIEVSNLSATPSPIIARNGKKIVGLEENLTIDTAYAGFRLVFTGDSLGWTIIGQ